MADVEARRLLSEARILHLATTRPDGTPVLRALNAVVTGDWVLFHGAKAGEKSQCLGRRAVVSAERTVATIPSYFVNPRLACPATTLYVSAQATGTLVDVEDLEMKARMLGALMAKYQPEGGHAPIVTSDPDYLGQLRGIRVFGFAIDELSGKAKLGQNKDAEYLGKILSGLWKRGAPGDVEAIRTLVAANTGGELPEFLRGPDDGRFDFSLREEDLSEIVQLLSGTYWHGKSTPESIADAHRGSAAWIGLRSPQGDLIATGRAISDGARHAYIADVTVEASRRGRGYGYALVSRLLEHPRLRSAKSVRLGTADRQRFYERLGFVDAQNIQLGFPSTSMVRLRE
jgi:nitroimidazol reductase NimA-like FMN-containing flavoprotein (pyridoxamine 5'-phosphate oxidase superfamily)/GNAT superfamily N-acetyltransferase